MKSSLQSQIGMMLLAAFSVGTAHAVEAPTIAGPIGGTDIRSAVLPPPGVYGGLIVLGAGTTDFVDKRGKTVAGLEDARLTKAVAGPYLYYVPEFKIFGGGIGLGAIVPVSETCGKLFSVTERECDSGVGDPYVELDWSRSFGTLRASKYPDAYPILEGLSVMAGIGVVIPGGHYDTRTIERQARSASTNILDIAPTVGFTYTTPPLIAEGTELSLRFFYNYYSENTKTRYLTGDVIDFEFALTEHIGRFQIGFTGFFATQIEDDKLNDIRFPIDGRQAEALQMGPIIAVDIPELQTSVKLKALTSFHTENTVEAWNVVFGAFKKF